MADALVAPPSIAHRSPPDPSSHPIIMPSHPCQHTLRINFPTVASALIVYHSVVVDEEIRPKAIYRHLRVDGNAIECFFSASEVKNLRVATSSFLEMLAMATETVAQFQLSDAKTAQPAGQ